MTPVHSNAYALFETAFGEAKKIIQIYNVIREKMIKEGGEGEGEGGSVEGEEKGEKKEREKEKKKTR